VINKKENLNVGDLCHILANGPDRVIDLDIFCAIKNMRTPVKHGWPAYTASLDTCRFLGGL